MPLMKRATALGAALTVGLGVTLAATQDEVTESDYQAAMQELRYLATDASLHMDQASAAASYWADVGEDSDKMRREFAKVESFWTAQEQPRAVELATQAIAAARSIGRASGAEDRAAGTAALAELRSVCQSCHAEFREETDDGFRIKPSALK